MAIDAIPTLLALFNPSRPTARDQACAAALWQAADQSWNTLARMSEEELTPLVGRAHAIRLRTAFAIGHAKLAEAVTGEPITTPMQVVALLQAEMSHLEQEELRVISLSTQAHIIGMHTVVVGTLNTAYCRMAAPQCRLGHPGAQPPVGDGVGIARGHPAHQAGHSGRPTLRD